jgi:hypothetical protein
MPSLKGPILGVIIAPLLTWASYSTAVQIQDGIRFEYSGRRAGLKQLMAWLAETLGPAGSLVVGGLVSAGMVAWLIVTLKKRKAVVEKS